MTTPPPTDRDVRRRSRRIQVGAVIAITIAYLLVLTRAEMPAWLGL